MPQVSIEFSKGLDDTVDIQTLCNDVFDALAGQDAFSNPSAIKVKAMPVDIFRVGCDPQTFVHAVLSLMSGRDEQTRKLLNIAILDVLSAALPEVGSLTVQDIQISPATYAKR